jgi:transcriptional regulator with XRE-family HTH domain
LAVDVARRGWFTAGVRSFELIEGGGSVKLGELLRRCRRQAGLSQAELASLSGLAVRTIRDVELGRTRRPHRDSTRMLADALRLTDESREAFERAAAALPSVESAIEGGPLPPGQLPRDVADFTGRVQQVKALRGLLSERGQGWVTIVCGLPGTGKTTLAVHVAHELSASFPDGQLFVELGGRAHRVGADLVLGWFLRALGVEDERIPVDLRERAALYRTLMAGRKTLVVLDDAADDAQVRPLLPGGPHCRTLVTSRARLVTLEGAWVLPLDLLDVETAVALLSRVAGRRLVAGEHGAAVEIVELCGLLPLAVRIAGARLQAQPGMACADLAEQLRAERVRLDELTIGDLGVRERLDRSYRGLDEPSRRVFRRLVWLEPPAFTLEVAGRVLCLPAKGAEALIQHLLDVGLLEVTGADGPGWMQYRFHQLTRLYGRGRGEDAGGPSTCLDVRSDARAAASRVNLPQFPPHWAMTPWWHARGSE